MGNQQAQPEPVYYYTPMHVVTRTNEPSVQDEKKSLYQRLGGIYPIAAVINDFSDALLINPTVGQNSLNPQLRAWSRDQLDRLPGLKWMRTLWVANITGGPYQFVATVPGKCTLSLENAHAKFKISPEEFDAVAAELKTSLQKFKVPEQEMQEVLQAFAAHKNEVTMGYQIATQQPVSQIVCPQ